MRTMMQQRTGRASSGREPSPTAHGHNLGSKKGRRRSVAGAHVIDGGISLSTQIPSMCNAYCRRTHRIPRTMQSRARIGGLCSIHNPVNLAMERLTATFRPQRSILSCSGLIPLRVVSHFRRFNARLPRVRTF